MEKFLETDLDKDTPIIWPHLTSLAEGKQPSHMNKILGQMCPNL